MKIMKCFFAGGLLAVSLVSPALGGKSSAPNAGSGPARVLAAPFSGVISPVAAEFLRSAILRAESEKFDAVVIELDTPGGLDTSMRDIVKSIMGSGVPVVVFVHPSGARATSAGRVFS